MIHIFHKWGEWKTIQSRTKINIFGNTVSTIYLLAKECSVCKKVKTKLSQVSE